jgi:kynurenine 3-monooxygenase
MYGRMIHGCSPTGILSQASQAYDVHGRFIRAVDRGGLNKRLLDELETMPNVKFFFRHKMTGADFRKKKAWFEVTQSGDGQSSNRRAPEIEVEFDLLLGADGAHSAARHHLMKFARMDFSQKYIDCLWCEFTIPPSKDGDFRISPNHLHIWPAGSFMFIALPSLDKSFTCTLF